jgi:hypothetical protein
VRDRGEGGESLRFWRLWHGRRQLSPLGSS